MGNDNSNAFQPAKSAAWHAESIASSVTSEQLVENLTRQITEQTGEISHLTTVIRTYEHNEKTQGIAHAEAIRQEQEKYKSLQQKLSAMKAELDRSNATSSAFQDIVENLFKELLERVNRD